MTSILDLGPSLIAALVAGGTSGHAAAAPPLIDPPALIAACRAHSRRPVDVGRWLENVHRVGSLAGLEPEAARIFITRSGHAYSPLLEERAHILSRAQDPTFAAPVAYFVARANQTDLQVSLGRQPTLTDLMIAEHVGPKAAASALLSSTPPARLAIFQDAALSFDACPQPTAVASGQARARLPAVAGWSTRIEPAVAPTRRPSRVSPSSTGLPDPTRTR